MGPLSQLFIRPLWFFWIVLISRSHHAVVTACGILVHTEVTYRSIELFQPLSPVQQNYKTLLAQLPGYVQAGSFFPDWGYNCLDYQEQSEDAHWPLFIKTAIDYIRDTYPNQQNEHVQGLIAFIFAVMSHDVADVRWHSLHGLSNYFIQAMAQQNFHGNYANAHTAADTGAESTLQHFSQLGYQNASWMVPVRDLVAIYTTYYAKPNVPSRVVPTEEHIAYCMKTAFVASRVDLRMSRFMFQYYGSKSPFLVQHINDYYKGGMQDMSAAVADCYDDVIQAFEEGSSSGGRLLCGSFFDDPPPQTSHRSKIRVDVQRDHVDSHYDTTTGVLTLSDPRPVSTVDDHDDTDALPLPIITHGSSPVGLIFQNGPEHYTTSADTRGNCAHLSDITMGGRQPSDVESLTLSLPASFVGLGHSTTLGDFNGDGVLDLAISAPYQSAKADQTHKDTLMVGQVFVLNGTTTWSFPHTKMAINDIRNASHARLTGQHHQGRFGWAMATVDLNSDGIDDLAIAAPFAKGNKGYVDVFFGGKHHPKGPDLHIELEDDLVEGFGLELAGLDMDRDGYKDLVIGCPLCSTENKTQSGAVYVVLANRGHKGRLATPDLTLTSHDPQPFENFGSSFDYVAHTHMLMVGAPGYNSSGLQRVGRVYGLDFGVPLEPRLAWIMAGESEFQAFGSVITTGKTLSTQALVAIASKTEGTRFLTKKYWQAGVVRVYSVNQLEPTHTTRLLTMNHGLLWRLEGQASAAHLGSSLSFFEKQHRPGLWVGEPMANGERGRVHRWDFTSHNVKCIQNDIPMARFGSRVRSLEDDAICITSQHYSFDARLSGAVHLLAVD